MSQLELTPEKLHRTEDPWTSRAAARQLKANTMRRRLLEMFRRWGPLTAEGVANSAGYGAEDGAWKRVSDLLNLGLIEDTGETRTASSGRQQRVLRITAKGREALA
jgi:hypothetical protein